jgi:hypothetical protein
MSPSGDAGVTQISDMGFAGADVLNLRRSQMKRILIVGVLGFAILATPCVYDVFSTEPSPLTSLLAAAGLAD